MKMALKNAFKKPSDMEIKPAVEMKMPKKMTFAPAKLKKVGKFMKKPGLKIT